MRESKNVKNVKIRYRNFFAINCVPMRFMQKIAILITQNSNFSQSVAIYYGKTHTIMIFIAFLHFCIKITILQNFLGYLTLEMYAISAKNVICDIRGSAILCDNFCESINCHFHY